MVKWYIIENLRLDFCSGSDRAVLADRLVGEAHSVGPMSCVMWSGAYVMGFEAAANHTSLEVQTSFYPHNSDHEPFIDEDIPSVLTIEGADGSNTDIHTARDTLDKIDFELAIEILRMNVSFIGLRLGNHL